MFGVAPGAAVEDEEDETSDAEELEAEVEDAAAPRVTTCALWSGR